MMTIDPTRAPWHRESFEKLMREYLPALLAERIPLAGYRAEEAHPGRWTVSLSVMYQGRDMHAEFIDLPGVDAEGVVHTGGQTRVVVPVATSPRLDDGEILCVGEQLRVYLAAKIAEAPSDLPWDEDMLREWVALDERLGRVLGGQVNAELAELVGWATVQPLDPINWLSRRAHLRRVALPRRRAEVDGQGPRRTQLVDSSELGRTCPFETPEGVNLGRVLSVARGAVIHDGRVEVVDSAPIARLGLSASLVPAISRDDANRALMGVNMMRQWRTPATPEPALVQTGLEPAEPGVWCGRNLLTAFMSLGADTHEDAIVISQSAASAFALDEPLEAGDKLSNRHGTKGTVSRILPDDQMPRTEDGRRIDLVFSFLGLHTRMNLGQLREAVLGLLAETEGQPVLAPAFGGPDDQEVSRRLAAAKLPDSGMLKVRLTKDAPLLPRPVTVGPVYWGSLIHTARRQLILSPQSASALAYQGLRDIGAHDVILDQWTVQPHSGTSRADLIQRLARGAARPQAPSPAFSRLTARLAAAGIAARLRDDQLQFSLSEPMDVALAAPLSHPWLEGRPLTRLGRVPDGPDLDAVESLNEQLGRLISRAAPPMLVERAKAKLQEAVNGWFARLVTPEQLRLDERVTLSARAVLAPDGELAHDRCTIPDEMAWLLFGPHVAARVGEAAVDARTPEAAAALDQVMAESWVLISREPVVMPSAVLAFRPRRRPERVIRLHPLACPLMNADYDGDMVAVFLPVTPEAQAQAAERLSITGHLRRDASLVRWVAPRLESLLGLAYLSLTDEGRKRICDIAGRDLTGGGPFVSRVTIERELADMLASAGPEAVLRQITDLHRLGFEALTQTGASMNPFAHHGAPAPRSPRSLAIEDVKANEELIANELVSRTDYDALDLGPQILSVKCGARGNTMQLVFGLVCRTIMDYDGRLHHFNQSMMGGLSPEACFMSYIGARIGLADVAIQPLGMMRRAYGVPEPTGPAGFGVLARAMRSLAPGMIFARAAATGEVDPLADVDARLFVGLRPR